MHQRIPHNHTPYLLLFPAVTLAIAFGYLPFFRTIGSSLHAISPTNAQGSFIGLEIYRRLFASTAFSTSLANTVRFTALFVPTNLCLCLLAAVVCTGRGRIANLQRTIMLLPMAFSLSSSMLVWKMLFNPMVGIVNGLTGSDIQWFNDPKAAMALLVMAGIWLDFGFDFLLFTSALGNIPSSLIEVTRLDGASAFQRFRFLTMPLIAPTVLFVLVNNIKDAMLICAPIILLTEGGPFRSTQTLVYLMYLEAFKSGNHSMGAAIATVAFLLTFAIMLAILAMERKRIYYR